MSEIKATKNFYDYSIQIPLGMAIVLSAHVQTVCTRPSLGPGYEATTYTLSPGQEIRLLGTDQSNNSEHS